MRFMRSAFVPFVLAAAALAAHPLAAQQRPDGVAQLKGVQGNVLLSRQAGLAAGGESARVLEGMRVITTARSEAVVVYDDGCQVRLKENQRFRVETGKTCAELMAQVESIFVADAIPAATGAIAGNTGWALLPAIGGAAIGIDMLRREKTPVSPS